MAMLPENSIYGNELVYKKKEPSCIVVCGHIPARLVLYLLSWSGFLVSFMMRTDINLAIVAMVEQSDNNGTTMSDDPDRCFNENENSTDFVASYGTLSWSPDIQSYILASFYWAYIVSQVIGGAATQRFGTKRVFGWAQFFTACCSLLMPVSAETSYVLVILLRCVQGFMSGLTWPAMYTLVGYWIPVPERSRFMSSFQGFSIGIGLTYPLCGVLIANLGWKSVFYTTGTVGLSWCILWYLLAFDSPDIHPRISEEEANYIKANTLSDWATNKQRRVPWRAILSSPPAWSIGLTTFGRIWVHYTFIINGPQYMKSILGFKIQQNGLLSGLPFICSYLSSVVFCYVADFLSSKYLLSLTNVRKLFTMLAQVVPGLLIVLIGYIGCNIVPVLVVWFIAVTFITAAYAGAMANVVDISPNLAGPVLAFAQTIHMTASFISPLVAGYLTRDGHTLQAWRNVFLTSCIVACSTYIIYQVWGTAKVQNWDDPNFNGEKKRRKRVSRDEFEENIDVQAPMIDKSGENSPI